MSGKPEPTDFKARVTALADDAVGILAELMRDASSEAVRIAAARELIDRAHGKPRGEPPGDGGPNLLEMLQNALNRKEP